MQSGEGRKHEGRAERCQSVRTLPSFYVSLPTHHYLYVEGSRIVNYSSCPNPSMCDYITRIQASFTLGQRQTGHSGWRWRSSSKLGWCFFFILHGTFCWVFFFSRRRKSENVNQKKKRNYHKSTSSGNFDPSARTNMMPHAGRGEKGRYVPLRLVQKMESRSSDQTTELPTPSVYMQEYSFGWAKPAQRY